MGTNGLQWGCLHEKRCSQLHLGPNGAALGSNGPQWAPGAVGPNNIGTNIIGTNIIGTNNIGGEGIYVIFT